MAWRGKQLPSRAGGNLRHLFVIALLVLGPAVFAQGPGYSGPSIMTQPGTPLGRGARQPLNLRFFVSAQAHYADDFASVDASGTRLDYDDTMGWHGNAGIYGYYPRQKDVIGIDYRLHYRALNRNSNYDGADHSFGLSYSRQMTAKTAFSFSQGLSSGRRSFMGIPNSIGLNSTLEFFNPGDEVFSRRSTAAVSSGDVTHMMSRDWGVSGGGNLVLIERQEAGLADMWGFSGSAQVFRMLGPKHRIGGFYGYSEFRFDGDFGQTRFHSGGLTLQSQLTPTWTFSARAGAARYHSERLSTVRLDPIIAGLLGTGTVQEAVDATGNVAILGATLGRTFERSSLSFYINRRIRPGNGFITTSVSNYGGIAYSYTATQRLNFGLHGMYGDHKAITQGGGRFTSYGGGLGVTYRLYSSLHFTARADVREHATSSDALFRTRYMFSAGIAWSPGELPLALW